MNKRIRKIIFWVAGILLVLVIALMVFISPLVKYLIEKNSEKYTGRKITIEKLSINLFTGFIHFQGLKFYELKSQQIFFQCQHLQTSLTIHKLFSSKYELNGLEMIKPVVTVSQHGNHFNYDDLVQRFAGKPGKHEKSDPVQYLLRNFRIDSATIIYINKTPYNKIEVLHCNIHAPLITWNDPVYNIHTDFKVGSGGMIKADIKVNAASLAYELHGDIQQFNCAALYPYIRDYMKVKSLDGLFSTGFDLLGNFNQPSVIRAKGNIEMEKFSIIDTTGEQLVAAEKMDLLVDSVDTKKSLFNLKQIDISRPFLRVAIYNNGYNFDRILLKPNSGPAAVAVTEYANIFIMMASYVKDIVENYVASNYNANQLKITGGHIIFTDYTLEDKFQYDLDSVYMLSNKISSNHDRIFIEMESHVNRSGRMKGTLSISPANFSDMDIDCTVSDLLISDLNPYSNYYVATPFLDGTINYTNHTGILQRKLKSNNLLNIAKIAVGKKVKNKTAMNIPVKLAVALLKDVHGNVHLDIPVKGSLDDPKFAWGKVVWQVIKNLLVKAVTAPFRLLANVFGGKEEDYKEINFDYMQTELQSGQQKSLDNLSRVLTEKPDLTLELSSISNRRDEAEALALFETKKQFLHIADADTITNEIRKKILAISNKDSLFAFYVDSTLHATSALTSIQEKCIRLCGPERIDSSVRALMENRKTAVISYLSKIKQVPTERIRIQDAKNDDQSAHLDAPKYIINIAAKD